MTQVRSGQLVELEGHSALLARGVVLVQKTVARSLVNRLDGHLVSALGLAAVAFGQSGLKLLDVGLMT